MEINGKDIITFSARLMRGWTIGAATVESTYFQGRNRTAFNLIDQTYGMKPFEFSLQFEGDNRNKISTNKSLFDLELCGTSEIYMPDGYWYTCVIVSVGAIEYDGNNYGRAKYELSAIQHKAMVTVKSTTFSCSSTIPFTDCIISGTTTGTSGSIGAITFSGVTSGKTLVVDGINKRFLYDGAPAAQKFVWVNFPYLVPGENTITTTGLSNVIKQYYPTMM